MIDMAASQSEIDAAISRLLTKGKRKTVSVDGMTTSTEMPSVEEITRLDQQRAAADTTKQPFLYKRFVNYSRGH